MNFLCIKVSQSFPKPYERTGEDINVKVDLSNYATKVDLKNATGADTSKLAAKFDLDKTEVDKLDIDKLIPVPIDLSNLSDVVKNDVVKNAVNEILAAKVNSIDTSGFCFKN